MLPSVLISSDHDIVNTALELKPNFTDPQVKALYNWCLWILTALFNYVTYFIGDNSDRTDILIWDVNEIKTQLEELQHHASLPAPDLLPARQPTTPKPGGRCQRCNVIGHDTSTCRTKDPVAVKKCVANNLKLKKAATSIQGQLPIPPRLHPYTQYFGDPIIPTQQPLQAYFTAIADAKELRRQKTQSTRDQHHKGSSSSS